MGRKSWVIGSFMVAMLPARVAGSQPAGPAPEAHGGGPGTDVRRDEPASELRLSGEQREKQAGIRERQMRRGIQPRADPALEHLDLRTRLPAETPSLTAVGAQIDEIARTRAGGKRVRDARPAHCREKEAPQESTRGHGRTGDGARVPRARRRSADASGRGDGVVGGRGGCRLR
jgi:hypothetical protein